MLVPVENRDSASVVEASRPRSSMVRRASPLAHLGSGPEAARYAQVAVATDVAVYCSREEPGGPSAPAWGRRPSGTPTGAVLA